MKGECPTKDCARPLYCKGLCRRCYNKMRNGIEPGTGKIRGRYSLVPWTNSSDGYIWINLPEGKIMEHRKVMEDHLGRKLIPGENVHHVNGNRSDNRLENLELWSRVQPSGQRVQDKVDYAIKILRMYQPESLSETKIKEKK